MSIVEELELRIARLEAFFEDVLKEKLDNISRRLDHLYEKQSVTSQSY